MTTITNRSIPLSAAAREKRTKEFISIIDNADIILLVDLSIYVTWLYILTMANRLTGGQKAALTILVLLMGGLITVYLVQSGMIAFGIILGIFLGYAIRAIQGL